MEEKRTGLFENGLIWFGAGVSIAEILDRNLSGTTWNGERTSRNYRRTYHRLPYVIPGRCNRW